MKQNIAVIFGGQSTEHDISIITALRSIIGPLRAEGKFEIVPVYISKSGGWYTDQALTDIVLYSSGRIDQFINENKKLSVEFGDGLTLVLPGLRPKRIRVDIAFPAMHGTHGEDGSLMGVLRMANIPFVGCDMQSSVIAMDKVLAKQVAQANGIATANFVHFKKHEFENDAKAILTALSKLQFPVFVKPAHLGSSIGISMVKNADELQDAIEVATFYDDVVIVEEAVNNLIEVTVPVMGNNEPIPALVERPNIQEFFDFDSKYIRNGKKSADGAEKGAQGYSEMPAKISKQLYDQSIDTAVAIFKAVGCSGLSRVDLLIDSTTNIVYFNELNPMPGSLYAHNWQRAGTSPISLVTKLINYALERHASKSNLEKTFSTSFLKQF